ncbi:MAG TPA: IS630 family transposase [Egibacteraceae bacterium]|nr:IS630 family transposase [Egibacteraceae bacterium]
MARKPEVFVRALTDEESQRLVGITRRSRDPVRLRRAMIVQMSTQGRSVPDITALTAFSDRYVREVIHAFNDKGFAALDPKWSGGRPPKIDDATRRAIRRVALSRPPDLGLPFTTWSLAKLRDHLIDTGVVEAISVEGLRRVLAGFGITFQATKTWKASPDPDYEAKKNRVLDLYDHPPADGRVICFDEFGPLNLQPHPGRGWYPKGRPVRLRATYTRPHGVRQMLAALDLASGQMSTASTPASAGRRSWPSSRSCAPAGPASACTSCWTTSPPTAAPKCATGAGPTTSSSCSPPPTPAG